ncbi:MAG: GLPGLI family protein [Tannerella sp.]|jgi:GLPGLI family protein|nr:GLPGLI family protein [Tannerella sp.]
MMKNIFGTVLCFILAASFSGFPGYGQEKSRYKCAYQFDFLKDTVKMTYFRQEIYIVQIGENITKGFTYHKFYLDSFRKQSPDLYRQQFTASVKESIEAMRRTGDLSHVQNNFFTYGGFPSDLYKDYRKKEIRVRDHISIYPIVYKDELKPQDWEILNDTATILGYHCQKARCTWRGRDWTAWFTAEIPVSEGPWKFYGLPGLITKLHDAKKHYSFELTGFQEIAEPIDTKLPKKTQKIERKEFIRTAYGAKGEMINRTEAAKVGISNDEPVQWNYDYIERDYK